MIRSYLWLHTAYHNTIYNPAEIHGEWVDSVGSTICDLSSLTLTKYPCHGELQQMMACTLKTAVVFRSATIAACTSTRHSPLVETAIDHPAVYDIEIWGWVVQ